MCVLRLMEHHFWVTHETGKQCLYTAYITLYAMSFITLLALSQKNYYV